MTVNVIVQARMGSKRFPGKVMADLHGKPMIGHLIDCLRQVKKAEHIIYAIPEKDKNGPLGQYLEEQNVHIVTGPEEDVAERFRLALEQFPCEGFIRICADSPARPPDMIDMMIAVVEQNYCEFNQFTGMPGTTVQYCRTERFLDCLDHMTEEEREHVLVHFERQNSLLVDYPEDIERVEKALQRLAAPQNKPTLDA